MLNSNQICPVCKDKMIPHGPGKIKFFCYKNTCLIELDQRYINIYNLKFVLNGKIYSASYYDHNYKFFELFYYKEPSNYYYLYQFKSEEFSLEDVYKTSTSFINNLIFM